MNGLSHPVLKIQHPPLSFLRFFTTASPSSQLLKEIYDNRQNRSRVPCEQQKKSVIMQPKSEISPPKAVLLTVDTYDRGPHNVSGPRAPIPNDPPLTRPPIDVREQTSLFKSIASDSPFRELHGIGIHSFKTLLTAQFIIN